MKTFFVFLLMLLGALALAQLMLADSGYVLLAYQGMSFESSLWGFLLLIVLAALAVWLVWLLLITVAGSLGLIYPITKRGRQRRARRLTVLGFNYFVNGQWRRAQKRLAKAAEADEAPLLNYLAAARAAQEAGDDEAAREYLRQADRKVPEARLAIGITQAHLLLSRNKLEQALATLKELHRKAPRHPYILKLLKQVYLRLPDWQALARLLPVLKRHKVVDEAEYQQLEADAYSAMFAQAAEAAAHRDQGAERLQPVQSVWQGLGRGQRRQVALVLAYARALQTLGAEVEAENVLRQSLVRDYSDELVELYGRLQGGDSDRQLLVAEQLLKERPNNAVLLLCLGRLSLRNQLWGKAREYFEASLRQSPSVAVCNELGRLLAHLGDHAGSSGYFRQAQSLGERPLPDLPMPPAPKANAA